MTKNLTSRHRITPPRGPATACGVGNLWPRAMAPVEDPLAIPGMEALARRRWKQVDVRHTALLQKCFDTQRSDFPLIDEILIHLSRAAVRYVVIGGWARDMILGRKPNDIDLVVVGISSAGLKDLLPTPSRRTALGGFSFERQGINVDLWSLEDTSVIQHLRVQPTLRALMQVIDFNVNAVLFIPGQMSQPPVLLEGGLSDAVTLREIDFNCGVLPLPIAQVARLAYLSAKLEFGLSQRARSFMHDQCVVEGRIAEVEANLFKHCPLQFRQKALDTLNAAVARVS